MNDLVRVAVEFCEKAEICGGPTNYTGVTAVTSSFVSSMYDCVIMGDIFPMIMNV